MPIMKTLISTTYETSPFLAGKKIKSQAKWYLFGRSYICFSISSPAFKPKKETPDLLVPYLHFGEFTPDTGQIVHPTIRNLRRLLEDHSGLGNLFMFLVIFGKLYPECMGLARRLFRVDGLDCFGVSINDVFWFAFEKFHSFVPFVHVVGILAK